MRHAGIQTGRVPTALTSRPLPLDAGFVLNYSHVAVILIWANIGLVLNNDHRALEEILASILNVLRINFTS